MTTLQRIEQEPCPGYTSPVTGKTYPAPGDTHAMCNSHRGVRCAYCGATEPAIRAQVEAVSA